MLTKGQQMQIISKAANALSRRTHINFDRGRLSTNYDVILVDLVDLVADIADCLASPTENV